MRNVSLLFGYVFAGFMNFGKNGYMQIQLILKDSLRGNHQKGFSRPLGNPVELCILGDRGIVD